jgi:NAD(P)-dependent dehydrogenase (short-subunit alcohol dehydrogenase family)
VPGRLFGEHVLVTGGSQGIGATIVKTALREGARVSFDVNAQAANSLIASLSGADVAFAEADVRSVESIALALTDLVARFGSVNGLVNNAGRNAYADPVRITEAE